MSEASSRADGSLRQLRSASSLLRSDRSPSAVLRQEEELERRRLSVVEQEEMLRRERSEFELKQMEAERDLQKRWSRVERTQFQNEREWMEVARRGGQQALAGAPTCSNLSESVSPQLQQEPERVRPGDAAGGTTMQTAHANRNDQAQQEIVSELREASALMAQSVTPEAANFWKVHILELQERLRSLGGELEEDGEGGTNGDSQISLWRRPPYCESFVGGVSPV